MKNSEIKKRIADLTAEIHSEIEVSPKKELTYGTNGYPEPYAGVMLIPANATEAKELSARADEWKEEIDSIRRELRDEDGDEAVELLELLDEVEIAESVAEWRNGWNYANPTDSSFCYVKQEKNCQAVMIENVEDLASAHSIDDVLKEFGVYDEVMKIANELAEKNDVEAIDILIEPKKYKFDFSFDGVVIETGDREHDYPELNYEWFSSKEEAQEWMDEEVLDCPANYDTRNYAVGLRIFGFTADLHDRLVAGGGMCNSEETAVAPLNIPKYK